MVVLTTLDYLDTDVQQGLVDFARDGGSVIIGPRIPQLDSLMRPCSVLADALAGTDDKGGVREARVGSGSVTVVSDLATVPEAVSRALRVAGVHEVTVNDPRLEVTIHSDPQDPSTKLVFVANPSAEPVEAEVGIGVGLKDVRDVWAGRDVDTSGATIAEPLAPYSIHVYRCIVTG